MKDSNASDAADLNKSSREMFRRKKRGWKHFFHHYVQRYLWQSIICFVIVLIHLTLLYTQKIDRFELAFLDSMFQQRQPIPIHKGITYITVSEDSLQKIGRWPWPRQYHATLTHILKEWGAEKIVFDVLFSEKSTELDDQSLVESMAASKNVYLPVALETDIEGRTMWIRSLSQFEDVAKGIGHINIFPDVDGLVRRIEPYLEGKEGESYPYLPLKLAYDSIGKDLPSAEELPFPLDEHGRMIVNWAGPWEETFNHISYVDILTSYAAIKKGLKPVIEPKQIRGKICFIGVTALGHTDIRPSPVGTTYPSIGFHANIFNSILTKQFIYPMPTFVNAIVLVFMGFAGIFFFLANRNLASYIIGLCMSVFWVGLSAGLFYWKGIWIHSMQPAALIACLFAFSAVFNLILERKERNRLFKLAICDGLTGLYVIRYFREILNKEVRKFQQESKPLSLLILDVDFFKKVNDTHGHAAGDVVLKEIAHILKRFTHHRRTSNLDTVARYGGEEFMILLRNCDLEQASHNVAERIRSVIEETVFHYQGVKMKVTVSIGAATLHEGEYIADNMVLRSDEALYRAKETGRNKVCVEDPDGHNSKHVERM